jgi:hypothetical protein
VLNCTRFTGTLRKSMMPLWKLPPPYNASFSDNGPHTQEATKEAAPEAASMSGAKECDCSVRKGVEVVCES